MQVNATVPLFLESASAGMGGYNPSGQPEFASQDMRRVSFIYFLISK